MHAPIALPADPKTAEEAMTWPDASLWMTEVEKEFNNLRSHQTIKHANDQDDPAMKTKLVLKYTYTSNYELRRKVRWVVCGYTQRKGVDYGDTFAPTTSNIVTNLICQICTAHGWFMATFDVSAAFLEGKADRVMYARLPKFFDPAQSRV
eukprot:gene24600-biopygen21268